MFEDENNHDLWELNEVYEDACEVLGLEPKEVG